METRSVKGIRIVYDPQEKATAALIEEACERSVDLCQAHWNLSVPADCRIYVMTSWFRFFFRSSPWPWRIMLGLSLPAWTARARRTWPICAAWTQRYGGRVAIGVKPPRLLAESRPSGAPAILVEEPDMAVNVQGVVCHELVHACSASLRLPAWLNEGIATVTTDRFLGRNTIRNETLALLETYQPKAPPPSYRALSRLGIGEAFAYHAVRGYWITRYLEEQHGGFLRDLLAEAPQSLPYERSVAAQLEIDPERFWQEIDGLVAAQLGESGTGS